MNTPPPQNWRDRCAELGLDPVEVRKVSDRYDMYQKFTASQGSAVLALDRWYHWYRLEKLADGHAQRVPPAAGCSIDADSGTASPVISEAEFLMLLEACRSRC